MTKKIKESIDELSIKEKWYAGTVIPTFISFIIYMFIGVPIYLG